MNLKLNFNDLMNTQEFCYFLGLLYADGYVNKSIYRISFSTTEEDFESLKNMFAKFYDFNVYSRKRQDNWKQENVFYIDNKNLSDFLFNIGFDNKINNCNKILNHIVDEECRRLFFTGYFDGDGCVYYHKKQYLKQAAVVAAYDQNWDFMIELCNILGITKYHIRKDITKNGHKSSTFRVCNTLGFNTLLSYIYGNNNFGFLRKKEKFQDAMH